jgi:Mn-dependent DtxR family transcriptional regulator
MARKINHNRLKSIYNEVRHNPGRKPGFIAHLLGIHRSEVTRSRAALDEKGYYLYEDERGGLWLFKKPRLS